MKKLGVEMSSFTMFTIENELKIGTFHLINYNQVSVSYELKNDQVSFTCKYDRGKEKKMFEKWLAQEKQIYTDFILLYHREIQKISDCLTFEGTILEERMIDYTDSKKYIFCIQYKQLVNEVKIIFEPSRDLVSFLYQILLPINSKGFLLMPESLETHLTKETLQRMWEPFRKKTKYRLDLLHMLR